MNMMWTDMYGNDHFIIGGIHYVVLRSARRHAWQRGARWNAAERQSAARSLVFGYGLVLLLLLIDLAVIWSVLS